MRGCDEVSGLDDLEASLTHSLNSTLAGYEPLATSFPTAVAALPENDRVSRMP